MSHFAPITSSLLARKGDAVPSAVAAKPSLFWTRNAAPPPPAVPDLPRPAMPPSLPTEPGKPHRMMVMLTASEFERLGIAAVKKGATRHQIVRAALDAHLERLKREFGGCGCMASGGCNESCGAA